MRLVLSALSLTVAALFVVELSRTTVRADPPPDPDIELVITYDPDTYDPILTEFDDDLPPEGSTTVTSNMYDEDGDLVYSARMYFVPPSGPSPIPNPDDIYGYPREDEKEGIYKNPDGTKSKVVIVIHNFPWPGYVQCITINYGPNGQPTTRTIVTRLDPTYRPQWQGN